VCGAVEVIDEEGAAYADLVAQQPGVGQLRLISSDSRLPMDVKYLPGGRIGQLS